MSILIGLMIVFLIVHVVVALTTNYTSFYWLGKAFVELEAMQNAAIHSIPAWVRSWRFNYKEERSHLKGIVNV
jgi:hypothetical protein